MAAEGTEQVVDQKSDASTTTDTTKSGAADQGTKAVDQKQGTQPDQKQGDRRDAGVLADLQKERKARQALEAQVASHKTELEAERRRVQALAGVTHRDKDEIEADEVRQQFNRLFPGLAKLNDAQVQERLERLLSSADRNEDTTQRYWNDRAVQMTTSVVEAVSKELGGELTERQVSKIRAAYANVAENDPEFLRRHEEGDKSLVSEFAKEWLEDWYEPAKRKVTADVVARQPKVPGARDRNLVTGPGEKAIDVNDSKAVEDVLVRGFRERGGQFGR